MTLRRICFLALGSIFLNTVSQSGEIPTEVKQLVDAANTFLQSLNETQKKKAHLAFKPAIREDWHYIPKPRKGLAWRVMQPEQKILSQKIFEAALSESGMAKKQGITKLEQILWERSNYADHRHPGDYYVSIFGQPGFHKTWGASLEGHHLSINLTIVGGREVFVTPSFFGADPDHVEIGAHSGLHPLQGEGRQGRILFQMLDEEQRKQAIIKDRTPREIATRAKRKVRALPTIGLPVAKMDDAQKEQVRQLLSEYLNRYRAPFVESDWAKIEATKIDKIHFAWAGSAQPGEPMYYRLQGPTFLIEYINVQNGGNHAHTVWRDFTSDFGRDALADHIKSDH
ncbi:MAG: DUF3500 domain-containing protein [Verrucomicrobiota bacterium]